MSAAQKTIGQATGLEIVAPVKPEYKAILTAEALDFVGDLVRMFRPRIEQALARRAERQKFFDNGGLPDFLPETKHIREGDWKIRGIPEDLLDRRVEITGPVDRKMVINALNTPVKCYMADFEDSCSPTWDAVIDGHINLRDAINRTISYTSPEGKQYKLNETNPVLIARARGWHLPEKHVLLDGKAIPGALLDYGLYFFHNHKALLAKGSGPYYYLPKTQSHHEAQIWADVMDYTEDRFKLPRGTIKATFLIETLPAVFEMHEILYVMRDHAVALNCGRWDYIFSYIKTLKNHADRVLPDRNAVGMDQPFLNAYSRLLIKTCHQRGAMAMGGMAAFIPVKNNPELLNQIMDKVYQDKEREAQNGHDGTWIAHPGLADAAMSVFSKHIGDGKNLMHVTRAQDAPITAKELLEPSRGPKDEPGLRKNIRVAVQYIEAWISGNGCVPIYNLMEDAATAEISRTQIWQWIRHKVKLDDGTPVTKAYFRRLLKEEMQVVKGELGEARFKSGRFGKAEEIMEHITTSDELVTFLTLAGYDYLD